MSSLGAPSPSNSLVASGYFAVDLISMSSTFKASPGGTATNVASGLASLGWASSLAGSVGDDPAGQFLSRVLSNQGVQTRWLKQEDGWSTPVLIQEPRGNDHRWLFTCPHCGERFARYRPPNVEDAAQVIESLTPPSAFFFDRTSRFSLTLAKEWSARGTLIVFEPSTPGRPELFDRAVQVSSIVKFSSGRSTEFEARVEGAKAALVKTQGQEGLDFKTFGDERWHHLGAPRLERIVDTAGAGDWTTVGLVAGLFQSGAFEHRTLSDAASLAKALDSGQALAAMSCEWSGFRPPTWKLPLDPIVVSPDFYCPVLTSSNKATQA
jgi:fructokinase